MVPARLSGADRPALLAHFTALDAEDRRLRLRPPARRLCGHRGVRAAHRLRLRRRDRGARRQPAHRRGHPRGARGRWLPSWVFSVLPGYRNAGLGGALRASRDAHPQPGPLLGLHPLPLRERRDHAHRAQARHAGIVRERGAESDAYLMLPPGDPPRRTHDGASGAARPAGRRRAWTFASRRAGPAPSSGSSATEACSQRPFRYSPSGKWIDTAWSSDAPRCIGGPACRHCARRRLRLVGRSSGRGPGSPRRSTRT